MVYTTSEDQCLVYVAWAPNGDCVYVGRSFVGFRRFANHASLEANREGIEIIELNWCKDRQSAIELEKKLIREHLPTANKVLYRLKPERRKFKRIPNLKSYLLKLDTEVYQQWSKAAVAAKMTTAEWIRSNCNAALNAQLGSNGNGSKAEHDAGRTAGVQASGRRAGVSRKPDSMPRRGSRIDPPRTAPAAVMQAERDRRPAQISHSPGCPCALCELRKKKLKK